MRKSYDFFLLSLFVSLNLSDVPLRQEQCATLTPRVQTGYCAWLGIFILCPMNRGCACPRGGGDVFPFGSRVEEEDAEARAASLELGYLVPEAARLVLNVELHRT